MLKRVLSYVCCSAVAVLLAVPQSVQAQSDSTHAQSSSESNKSKNNNARSSPDDAGNKMAVSKTAVQALRLTDQARKALIGKDENRAQTDVAQAIKQLDEVDRKLPNSSTGNTHVVPIYAELEQTSFLAPALDAKNTTQRQDEKTNSASNSTQNSPTTQAKNDSSPSLPQSDEGTTNAPEVVKWVEGGYSYIGLDVNAAREHLQAAQQALKSNKPGNADLELARAEGSVVTGEIQTNMPLVRARENLSLARVEIQQGKYAKAKADLNAAGKTLANYSNDNMAPHAKEAKTLASNIRSMANTITEKHTGSDHRIDTWWNELANWTGQS